MPQDEQRGKGLCEEIPAEYPGSFAGSRITAGHLARRVPFVAPQDSLRRAAQVLRSTGAPVLPVVAEGQVVGTLSDTRLLSAAAWGSFHGVRTTVADVMDTPARVVPDGVPLRSVVECFRSVPEAALPVVQAEGRYLGMLSRAELAGAMHAGLRPPRLGGMATPLGVYLTTGNQRAGAGDLGLFLTGVVMFLLLSLAHWGVYALLSIVDVAAGMHFAESYLSPYLAQIRNQQHLIGWFSLAQLVAFLLLMRASPLTGTHAAEHQVVHAIEHGQELTLAAVNHMPRAHRRCGTNLAVAAMFFFGLSEVNWIVAVVGALAGWRFFGMWLQTLFTTKKPSPKQLANGLQVGQAILRTYEQNPSQRQPRWLRIRNYGFLQVLAGMMVAYGLALAFWQAFDWAVPRLLQ